MGNEASAEINREPIPWPDSSATWAPHTPQGCATAPAPREGACIAAVTKNDKPYLYVYGGGALVTQGRDVVPCQFPSVIHVYDVEANAWTEINGTGDVPQPRTGAACALSGNKMFIFGGMAQGQDAGNGVNVGGADGGWSEDTYSFDIDTNVWAKVAATGTGPSPRDKLAATTLEDGTIFVFGGFGPAVEKQQFAAANEAFFTWFNDAYVFSPATSEWRPLVSDAAAAAPSQGGQTEGGAQAAAAVSATPSPRAAFGMARIGSHVYVTCGKDPQNRQNDTYRYDLSANRWGLVQAVGKHPDYRSFTTLVPISDTRMLLFGGVSRTDVRFSDVNLLDVSREKPMWLQPSANTGTFQRGFHCAAVAPSADGADRLYVFGGSADSNGTFYNDMVSLELQGVRAEAPQVPQPPPQPEVAAPQ
eukprot:TRINITY_DN5207_c0_g2_i1.p1 TRINITY_DN5207_c0_g2~~TRINITY_DN5207_c0_g2_i1.p1  ORF type:complete len:426 (+),score=59.80 TRINITY_DN5207_c0_g2_i1:27-1280(+)